MDDGAKTDTIRELSKEPPPVSFVMHWANRIFIRMLDTELRPLGITSALPSRCMSRS